MMFFSQLDADFVAGSDRIVIEAPLVFYDDTLQRKFTVPEGFVCDGASIPRLFWTLVGHPLQKGVRKAAVLHDFLYRTGACQRADADRIFLEAMKEEGVNWLRRNIYWLAVRSFGWLNRKDASQ